MDAHILRENRRIIWKGFNEELNRRPESMLFDTKDWGGWKAFLQDELNLEQNLKPYSFCTVRRALLLKKIEEAQLLEQSTPSV